jgi:hypothetical protein
MSGSIGLGCSLLKKAWELMHRVSGLRPVMQESVPYIQGLLSCLFSGL